MKIHLQRRYRFSETSVVTTVILKILWHISITRIHCLKCQRFNVLDRNVAKIQSYKPCNYYRPQRSCGQGNIFTPVCHSVHRGGMSEADPPGRHTPPPPSRHTPLRAGTPPIGTPPLGRYTPPAGTPPQTRPPPPSREAHASIRSMSGRYASYWNAFL